MSYSFSIDTQGMEVIQRMLQENIRLEKTLAPAIGKAFISFHRILEKEVNETYNTKRKLSESVVGGFSAQAPRFVGNNVLEFGLTYKGERLPLSEFITGEGTVSGFAGRFMIPQKGVALQPKGLLPELIKRKTPNKQYFVTVRKGQQKVVRGLRNKGSFILQESPKQLGTRMTEETWKDEPNIRAPYAILHTLSLPEMAENTFNHSSKVMQEVDVLQSRLSEALISVLGA